MTRAASFFIQLSSILFSCFMFNVVYSSFPRERLPLYCLSFDQGKKYEETNRLIHLAYANQLRNSSSFSLSLEHFFNQCSLEMLAYLSDQYEKADTADPLYLPEEKNDIEKVKLLKILQEEQRKEINRYQTAIIHSPHIAHNHMKNIEILKTQIRNEFSLSPHTNTLVNPCTIYLLWKTKNLQM